MLGESRFWCSDSCVWDVQEFFINVFGRETERCVFYFPRWGSRGRWHRLRVPFSGEFLHLTLISLNKEAYQQSNISPAFILKIVHNLCHADSRLKHVSVTLNKNQYDDDSLTHRQPCFTGHALITHVSDQMINQEKPRGSDGTQRGCKDLKSTKY